MAMMPLNESWPIMAPRGLWGIMVRNGFQAVMVRNNLSTHLLLPRPL